jgi:hypothetical protein
MSKPALDIAISHAWQEAGRDLGIGVTAPFALRIGDREVAFEALIRDFGSPMGTIAVASETSSFGPSLQRLGYFVSQLFPSYRAYSREHFIATLDDWRWFGPSGEQPSWYSGKPWS